MKKMQNSLTTIQILICIIYWGARFTAFASTIQKYAFISLLFVFALDKVLNAHSNKANG